MDDYDYRPPTHRGPRVLWGRIAFYGLSLALVFTVGLWVGGDDSSGAQLEQARTEIERLSQENVQLRAEKEALEAGETLDAADQTGEPEPGEPPGEGNSEQGTVGDDAEAAVTDDAEADGSAGSESAVRTYVVEQGDTGHEIAEQVYGDRDLWPLIVEANQLDGDNALRVDQELVIPPAD